LHILTSSSTRDWFGAHMASNTVCKNG
jgi:hypothetical protein